MDQFAKFKHANISNFTVYERKIWCKRRYYGRVRGVILRSGKVSGELNTQTERVVWKEWIL